MPLSDFRGAEELVLCKVSLDEVCHPLVCSLTVIKNPIWWILNFVFSKKNILGALHYDMYGTHIFEHLWKVGLVIGTGKNGSNRRRVLT